MVETFIKSLKVLKKQIGLRKRLLIERYQIVKEFKIDHKRFQRYCTPRDSLYQLATLEHEYMTQIDRDVHRVEKGLALRSPKRPFGKDLQVRLEYLSAKLPAKNAAIRSSLSRAIEDLDSWNSGAEVSEESAPNYQSYKVPTISELENFFWSRKSLRVFSSKRVSRDLISQAVELARNSPSVCNRQSWRVYAIDQADLLAEVLPLQNGNESFRSEIGMALIVTSDLNKFSGAGERNQVWIDGGLFSMSLAWALHGLGLGTCMLNWSVSNSQSDKLRTTVGIGANEEIMMLLAVGHPESDIRYARSEKKSAQEILFWPGDH